MTLVEALRPVNRDPEPVCHVEREMSGRDRTAQQGGMNDVWENPRLTYEATSARCLGTAAPGQAGVFPAGKYVFRVPFALAMAEKDKLGTHSAFSFRNSRHRCEW
jgi:hypothetical protein